MKREDLKVGGTVYVPPAGGWSNWAYGGFEIKSIGKKLARTTVREISIDLKTMKARYCTAQFTVPVYRNIEEYLEVQEKGRFINLIKDEVQTTAITYDQAVKIQAILEQQT